MTAIDSSTLIDWLKGLETPQTAAVHKAMDDDDLYLPPPVEAELLSFPLPQSGLASVLDDLPRLDLVEGFWARAGQSRRVVLAAGRKAKLADALIAQLCIDHDAHLITSDADFRHFATHCGLKLAV